MEYVLKPTKKSGRRFISGSFEHVSLSGGQLWILLSGNAQASTRIKGSRRYAITSQKDKPTKNWQQATPQGMIRVKICMEN